MDYAEKLDEHDVKIETLLLYQGTELHQDQLEDLIGIYDNEELSHLLGDEELFRDSSDRDIHDYFDKCLMGALIAEVHTPVKKPFGRNNAMSWSWGTCTITLIVAKDMDELVKKSCEWADKKEDEFRKGFEKEKKDER
jgi:hypothetical protein